MILERQNLHPTISELQSRYQSKLDKRALLKACRKLSCAEAPKPDTCQFIEGEPKQRQFCGQKATDRSSYCEYHTKVCIVRIEPLTDGT